MPAEVLYVSFDGVLQPLAFSQVVRVVAGLGRRGVRYHLLSLERPDDLARPERMREVEDALQGAGVGWTPLAVASMGTAGRAARTVATAFSRAVSIIRREGIRLVHARGYQSALCALALKRSLGVPYLFDARGYWIEERSGPGGWFGRAAPYAAGKLLEQAIFRGATGVVTLTDLQSADVAAGLFGPPPRVLQTIPTCADYQAFSLRPDRPGKPQDARSVPESVRRRLAGSLVLGIVGALNDTYFVRETLALAKKVLDRSPSAHLLVVSAQHAPYQAAIASAAIAPERCTITSAAHSAMPDWLQWIDWGLLLVPETAANRAKMPTKLAEFFATGVRPAFFGCNSDAARWVARAGSGYVLGSVGEDGLNAAAEAMTGSPAELERLRAAREITAPHFSLAAGVARYEKVVGGCLSTWRAISGAAPA